LEDGGEGIHPMVVDAIIEALPKEAIEAVDDMIDYYDTVVYDRLNKAFKEQYNIDLPKEHRYFPIMRLNSDRIENEIVMDMMMRQSSVRSGLEKGMIKKRVKSEAAFDRMSYYDTIIDNLRATNHFSAFAVPIAEVNQVINNPEIKSAMKQRNEIAYNEVAAWVKRNAYGKISQPGGQIAKLAESLRLAYVPAVLGGNFMTMLKQGSSFSIGADRLENRTRSVPKAIAKWATGPRKMTRQINEMSPFMRDRRDSFQREFSEMAEKMFKTRILGTAGLKNKSKEYMEKFKQFSMEGIKAIDSVTVNLLWTARYSETLNKTGSHEQAVDAADELIRKTQPTGGVLNLPSSFTGNAFERMYSMFMNQPNQNLNNLFELGSRWGYEKTSRNLGKIFWRVVLPSAIFYTMSNAFQNPIDDPEGWTKEMIRQMIGGIPLFGQAILAASDLGLRKIRSMRGGKTRIDNFQSDVSPSAFSILEDIIKTIQMPTAEKFAKIAAKTKGLPVIAYNRTTKAIEKGDWKYMVYSSRAMEDKSLTGNVAKFYFKDRKEYRKSLSKLSSSQKSEVAKKIIEMKKDEKLEKTRKMRKSR